MRAHPSAARILRAVQTELATCLALLPAPGRGSERQQGQREALQHLVVFLRTQTTPAVPPPEEPPCPPQ